MSKILLLFSFEQRKRKHTSFRPITERSIVLSITRGEVVEEEEEEAKNKRANN